MLKFCLFRPNIANREASQHRASSGITDLTRLAESGGNRGLPSLFWGDQSSLTPLIPLILILPLLTVLVACMPVARDDFSTFENDEFSRLVQGSYSEVNLTPGHSYGLVGVGRLDTAKAKSLANDIFDRKNKTEVLKLFHENGGKCESTNGREILRCEFTRRWKLKNIGAPFDVNNWSDPSAKFEFVFAINKSNQQVGNLDLKIINITEYKQIRDIK